MENDIWNEISSFLNQLRCENINRESYIYFQELANIQLKKKMEKEKVNKLHPGTRNLKNFALPMILCNLAMEIEHILGKDYLEQDAPS